MKKKTVQKIIFFLLLIPLASAAASSGGKVFKFAPPDKTVCFLTVTTTTTRQFDENTPVIDVVKKEWKITYRIEEDCIKQIWEPRSVMTSRDGQEFVHPVHTVLMEFPFTLTLDFSGQAVSVEGLAGVQDRMKNHVPDRAWQALAPLITEEMLVHGEVEDWRLLAGECAGKKTAIGTTWDGVETFGLAKRAGRPYFRLVRVKEPIHYAGRRMLKVEEFRNTELEALKKMSGCVDLAFSQPEIEKVTLWKDEEDTRKVMTGEGFRILDPESLLLYYAYLNLTEHAIFQTPEGKESVLKLNEEREFRFNYK